MSDAADKGEARQARRIAAAFRDGLIKARARVDRQALIDAIARGDRSGASRLIMSALAAEGFAAVAAAWGHAAAESGRIAADEAPDLPVRKAAAGRALLRHLSSPLGSTPAGAPHTSISGLGLQASAAAPDYPMGNALRKRMTFDPFAAAWGHAAESGRIADDEAPDLPATPTKNISQNISNPPGHLDSPVRKRMTFDPFASAGSALGTLSRWARELGASLLALAMRAVDAVLGAGMAERAQPAQLADDLIAVMGLSPRDAQAVVNYRGYLENRDRAALRSQLRDARNDPRILDAIREDKPLPPEYVDKLVARYAARLEANRAEFIGRTEALRARWSGVQAMWSQQVEQGLVSASDVRFYWVHRHDDRVRHAHREIPVINPNGVGLGEAFRSSLGAIRFPGDPEAAIANTARCRCSLDVRLTSEALAA